MALDAAGNLYVANNGNSTVVRLNPLGVGTIFASGGVQSPTYLAFQVPEPSTWALLGLGAAGLGLAMSRRYRVRFD